MILDHIHPIDGQTNSGKKACVRFFASFQLYDGIISNCMHTYGYDGEWFFVGGGSSMYNIDEVACNANAAGGNHWYHNPDRNKLAIDYIFTNKRKPMPLQDPKRTNWNSVSINEIEEGLKSALREYKLEEILQHDNI